MTRAMQSNDRPQMSAYEREFAFARHSGAGRNPACQREIKINMDPGLRRNDEKVAA